MYKKGLREASSFLGGGDLLRQNRSLYRSGIRSVVHSGSSCKCAKINVLKNGLRASR